MPFQPGNPGKPKGAKTKKDEELRDFFDKFIHTNRKSIQMDFDSLKPVQRLQFISDILPFLIPKLRATEISGEINGTITFKDAE